MPHLKDEHGRTSVFLQVTLTPTSEQTITVDYRTVDGTARSTTDYLAARGTLTFLPGETVQMIEVQMKPDRRPELDETFSVELSNAVGATIEDGTATVTIRDDD